MNNQTSANATETSDLKAKNKPLQSKWKKIHIIVGFGMLAVMAMVVVSHFLMDFALQYVDQQNALSFNSAFPLLFLPPFVGVVAVVVKQAIKARRQG